MPENQDWSTLLINRSGSTLTVQFNRPKSRNALSLEMVNELEEVLNAIEADRSIHCLVLRGHGGHFCAGGDIKDMAKARNAQSDPDPIAILNRRFGTLIQKLNQQPQTVVIVVQGAAMGGGFGLVCVGDIVIADKSAKFRLPETSLGLPPAQIAPFLVQKIGLSTSRRMALTGAKLSPSEALSVGLIDHLYEDESQLNQGLDSLLSQIKRCAPVASATTKRLLLATEHQNRSEILDQGALDFAAAARSAEGMEGMMAFIQKRTPKWAEQ